MNRGKRKSTRSKLPAPVEAPRGLILGIVGTDTEVGKTIVTASLARAFARAGLRVGVFKPFASDPARRPDGTGFSTDADLLARAVDFPGGADAVCGQLFSAPLAPFAAARSEGRNVDYRLALAQKRRVARRFDITLIEGCGGWIVPLTYARTTADYFAALLAPIVVVARTGLGSINHTQLTVDAVRGRGLDVLGIVLNRTSPGRATRAELTNPPIIARLTGAPVWGPVPYRKGADNKRLDRVKVDKLPDMTAVADEIAGAMGLITRVKRR